ncbi:hypothetical protein [Myxococcus sp. Y35]|uniref:hypothetical protein n=1 Tax=Pseudomyxococcus flavus TaxID=3115648 RepID=UPI003CF3CB78
MKFLCDTCERLVPLETFRSEAGGLVVTCGRCGAESRAGPSVGTAPRVDEARARVSETPAVFAPVAGGTPASVVPAPSTGPGAEPMGSVRAGAQGQPSGFASEPVGPVPTDVLASPGASPPPVATSHAAQVPPSMQAMPAPRAGQPALRVVRGEGGQPLPLTDAVLFEPPPGVCPKCVAPRREEALACSQCGLVYVNYVPESQPLSDVLMDAWRNLAARWDDWDAHDRLMTLAVGRGELAMVGRLYRIRLARVPHDTFAQRGRDEVVRRATLVVPSSAEPSGASDALQRMKKIAVGVGFIVVLVLAVLVFQHMRKLMAGY